MAPFVPVSDKSGNLVLAGILVMAAALRFFHLDVDPLWYDEIFTHDCVANGLRPLYWCFLGDVHPPLYYSLLYGFLQLTGLQADDAYVLRLPSVMFSTAAVALFYMLACRLTTRPLALWATLLVAISPFQIWYAQEARMYALLSFFVLLGLLGLSRATLSGEEFRDWKSIPAHRQTTGMAATFAYFLRKNHYGWLLYIIGVVGAMYTHTLGVLFGLSAAVYILALGWHNKSVRPVAEFVGANTFAIVLYLPIAPVVLGHVTGVTDSYWIPYPSLDSIVGTVARVATGDYFLHLRWLEVIALLLSLGILAWDKRHQRGLAYFVLIFSAMPVVISLFLSLLQPVFLHRTLIWLAFPLALSVVVASDCFWIRLVRKLILFFFLIVSASNLFLYYSTPRYSDWPGFLMQAKDSIARADLLIFTKFGYQKEFEYFSATEATQRRMHLSGKDLTDVRNAVDQSGGPVFVIGPEIGDRARLAIGGRALCNVPIDIGRSSRGTLQLYLVADEGCSGKYESVSEK